MGILTMFPMLGLSATVLVAYPPGEGILGSASLAKSDSVKRGPRPGPPAEGASIMAPISLLFAGAALTMKSVMTSPLLSLMSSALDA